MLAPLNIRRKALSAVVSSIILSAAVLVVGGAVWSYANGASSVIASQYHSESMELIKQLQERIMIEHVNNSDTEITIFIYNYGDVDVEVDVYINNSNSSYNSNLNNPIYILSKDYEHVTIDMSSEGHNINSGDNIGIKLYTRRQNIVHYSYIAQ